MVDLSRAVDDLVDAATREVQPRALKGTVEKMLASFEDAPENARSTAIRTLGRALDKVEGRGAQILSLALGALVEGGASPELTWPIVGGSLEPLLDRGTAFASAAVKEAEDAHVETAIESAGAIVAKKKPREAAAWKALPSRCLAAVACLIKSKKLRARMSKVRSLQEAAWPLSDAVAEVGYLLQALRVIDDETFLVLAPDADRGWLIKIDEMPSNAELYILLADAVIGEAKHGRLPGKRPPAKAVAAIREGVHPPKAAASVTPPFHLVDWTAVTAEGALPPADPDEAEHWIWMEGIPWDIPYGPGGQRVVLIQAAPEARPIPVAPSFDSLRPDVRIAKELSADEVRRAMLKLGAAVAKHSSPSAKAKKPTKRPAKRKAPKTKSRAKR